MAKLARDHETLPSDTPRSVDHMQMFCEIMDGKIRLIAFENDGESGHRSIVDIVEIDGIEGATFAINKMKDANFMNLPWVFPEDVDFGNRENFAPKVTWFMIHSLQKKVRELQAPTA